jgi:hypothetical protein
MGAWAARRQHASEPARGDRSGRPRGSDLDERGDSARGGAIGAAFFLRNVDAVFLVRPGGPETCSHWKWNASIAHRAWLSTTSLRKSSTLSSTTRGACKEIVKDCGRYVKSSFTLVQPGYYTLKIWIDPGIVLERAGGRSRPCEAKLPWSARELSRGGELQIDRAVDFRQRDFVPLDRQRVSEHV